MKSWNVEGARQVSYFGGGVGGTVIGFGASMLAMTDDLYKSLKMRYPTIITKRYGLGNKVRTIHVLREAAV